ncbi:phosphate regulon sensor histidine kinase PhoR [Polynucleobacter sp. IMCC30063]|uniref:phosphate regulon sensor histidine kinase PhoR n=1 Tax=unclassified Polynucleobacter TaxID=2640945 RepID=UPI001F31852C|nr:MULTISPECIES: phosphate regulon sensor histidine kinase PhoR [unclassified Polynucleobacter]MCE7505863.1 phosphate regulon sensor histidine kinase PhoR [Polynucleobacter sp. IMCC30063]MCE7527056.1 phosphate regulon sensor histidine kinase PhoR [Polynucleobacter sp. IMCC 30228]MCE7529317.1 phosphate regulon sensor histidine kinase PhoR [Polynucleobacter sp. IMCC 29146]
MVAILFRFIFLLILAIIAFGVGKSFFSEQVGLGIALAIVGLPLAYSYINLARLRKYIMQGEIENLPSTSGKWEDVLFRLQRFLRGQRQQLHQIEAQHERFIQAFQASPNGIVMLDDRDQIEWCNAIAESYFGLNFKRDALQQINYLIRRPEFVRYLSQRNFDEPLLIEQMGQASNLTLLLQLFPFSENRHLLFAQDITDLRKTEAMRRDFVANVSHEMRTPLTVMLGFLETVLNLDLDEVQRTRYLEMMQLQAKRMQSLVEDLLTLANLEANLQPPILQAIDMPALMALLKNDAEALSQGKHIFEFSCDQGHDLLGNQKELLSAFSNLVANAVHYTPEGGKIKISLVVNEVGQGVFSVEDTGPGISAEHLPRLTERFYRVDRSRSRETGGTGLGLAIVKHIANRYQAQLLITSVPGKGSTFSLQIPTQRVVTI